MVQHRAHPGFGRGSRRPVRSALPRHRRHPALCRAVPSDLARGGALDRMEEGGGHPVDAEDAAAFLRPFAHRVRPLHPRAVKLLFSSHDEGRCPFPPWVPASKRVIRAEPAAALIAAQHKLTAFFPATRENTGKNSVCAQNVRNSSKIDPANQMLISSFPMRLAGKEFSLPGMPAGK